MQPWQCCITVIQLGTFHHTAKQLLKAKLRDRWDFCHVSFSALLCSNIEVVLSLCGIDWFVMGCGKCFPVKAEVCVQSGFVCSLCCCLLEAGRLCSRAAWALRAPEVKGVWGLENQDSCCWGARTTAEHFKFINKPSFHLRGYRSSSLLPCGIFWGGCVMCEPIRFFLWL